MILNVLHRKSEDENSFITITKEADHETDYPFTLQRLSKGDIGYREAKLNYQITVTYPTQLIIGSTIYKVRLNWRQAITIKYWLRQYYVQTPEFWKHLINYSTTGILSFLGGLVVGAKSCSPNTAQPDNAKSLSVHDSTTITHQAPNKNTHAFVDSTIVPQPKNPDSVH